jgi:single-strand DNA-binding protein
MADLNKVMLIGRLTRDPALKYLPSQSAVCDFGFAVGRKFKLQSGEEREETTFLDCSLFGKSAEIFNQYMQKGKQCYLEGRLKLDSWDDKTTGQKRNKITVVVENFIFLGGPGQGGGAPRGGGDEMSEGGGQAGGYSRPGGYGGGGDAPRAQSRPAPARPAAQRPAQQQPPADDAPPFSDEQQFSGDDIPF